MQRYINVYEHIIRANLCQQLRKSWEINILIQKKQGAGQYPMHCSNPYTECYAPKTNY